MARAKIRWADTLDEEEFGEVLPPTTVKGPDSHGVKIVTEYFRNDKNEAIKKVTKSKVVQVEKKVYKVRSCASARACAHRRLRTAGSTALPAQLLAKTVQCAVGLLGAALPLDAWQRRLGNCVRCLCRGRSAVLCAGVSRPQLARRASLDSDASGAMTVPVALLVVAMPTGAGATSWNHQQQQQHHQHQHHHQQQQQQQQQQYRQ